MLRLETLPASAAAGWPESGVSISISPDFLLQERLAVGDRWFRQEYLSEFGPTEATVFDRALIEHAITTDVKPLRL